MKILKHVTWVGTLLLAAAPAVAGPNFIEGMCNGGSAGSLPGSACGANGFGALSSISGATSVPFGPGALDLEDMYIIRITDASIFSATTMDIGTTFDTQLWLFRVDAVDPLADGLGLLGNNDISSMDHHSMLGPLSTDGTGIVITEGLYYLAISGGAGLGVPDPGRFPVAGGLAIFDLAMPTEISGPDGFGGMFAIDGWLGEGAVGNYVIHFEGVSFIPAPGAAWALCLFAVQVRRRRRTRPERAPAACDTAGPPRFDRAARTRR